jgi:hypothetical protein
MFAQLRTYEAGGYTPREGVCVLVGALVFKPGPGEWGTDAPVPAGAEGTREGRRPTPLMRRFGAL